MSDAACRASQNAMRLISFISSPSHNNGRNERPSSVNHHYQQYSPNTTKRRNYKAFRNSIQPASPVYEAPSDRLDRELSRSIHLQQRPHQQETTSSPRNHKNNNNNKRRPSSSPSSRHVSFISNHEPKFDTLTNSSSSSSLLTSFAEEFLQLVRNQKEERRNNNKNNHTATTASGNSLPSSTTTLQKIESEYAQSLERLEEALTQKECELMMREAEIMLGEAAEIEDQSFSSSSPGSAALRRPNLPTATLSLITSSRPDRDHQHDHVASSGRISKLDLNIQKCRDEISSLRELLIRAQRQQSQPHQSSPMRTFNTTLVNNNEEDDRMEKLLLDFIRQKQLEEQHQQARTRHVSPPSAVTVESSSPSQRRRQEKRRAASSLVPIVSPAVFDDDEDDENFYTAQMEQEEEEEEEEEVYEHFPSSASNGAISRISVHSPPRLAPANKLRSRKYYAPTYKDIQQHYKSMQAFSMNDDHQQQIYDDQNNNNSYYSSTLKDRPIFSAVELMRHYEETGLQRKYGITLTPNNNNHHHHQQEFENGQSKPSGNNNATVADRFPLIRQQRREQEQKQLQKINGNYTDKNVSKNNGGEDNSSLFLSSPTKIQLLDRSSQLDTHGSNYSPIRTTTVPPQVELIHAEQERRQRKRKSTTTTTTTTNKRRNQQPFHDDDEDVLSNEEKRELKMRFKHEMRKRQDEINKNFTSETSALPLVQGRETQWIAHTCDAFRRGSIIETTCLLSDLISGRSWYCSLFLLRRHAIPHLPELQLPSCVRCTLFVEDIIDAALMQDEFTVTVNVRASSNNLNRMDDHDGGNDEILSSNMMMMMSSPARLAAGANYAGVPCSISKSLGEQHLKIECETKVEARTWLELFALSILEQQKQGQEASP